MAAATSPPEPGAVWQAALSAVRFSRTAEYVSLLNGTAWLLLVGEYILRILLGEAGYATALGCLTVLALVCAITQRHTVHWWDRVPLSLVLFVSWSLLSIGWASKGEASINGLIYLTAVTVLALTLGVFRDLIQIIRALGFALRFWLGVSLALEVLSGVLIDQPIRVLGISGNLGTGGPIQGIFGTRNDLAVFAAVAIITFTIEWRAHTISRQLMLISCGLAALLLTFSGSAIQLGTALVTALLAAMVLGIRQKPLAERRRWQVIAASAGLILAAFAWLLRNRIVAWLGATTELETRLELWQSAKRMSGIHPLIGWGWVGEWPRATLPFLNINHALGTRHHSALSAFVDVGLQLGLIGLVLLCVLLGLATVRSFLLATERRSVVLLWPLLVLAQLLVSAFAESFILSGAGWALIVVIACSGAHQLSWRTRLRPVAEAGSNEPADRGA